MFSCCHSLKKLDLSSFNTDNVVNMDHMFEYCINLKKLNSKNFNATKVANSYNMFAGCRWVTKEEIIRK